MMFLQMFAVVFCLLLILSLSADLLYQWIGTCRNCDTAYMLPIQSDEGGPYVELETEPCHDDGCSKKLCACCPQFVCSVCTLTFCQEHLIRLGTQELCRECAKILQNEAAIELAEKSQ